MNSTMRIMALTVAVALITGLAVAQQQQQWPQQQQQWPQQQQQWPQQQQQWPQQQQQWEQQQQQWEQQQQQQELLGRPGEMEYRPRLMQADNLIGMDVVNHEGENLGNLEEIVLEPNLNYVSYGVLSLGGFLGIGEDYHAIPWDLFELSLDQETLILNLPEEAFDDVEGFDRDNWPDRADQRWRMQIVRQPMQQQQQIYGRPQQQQQQWRDQQQQQQIYGRPQQQQQQWRDQQQRDYQQWREQQRQQQIYGRPQQQQQQWRDQQQQQQWREQQRQQQIYGRPQQQQQRGMWDRDRDEGCEMRKVSELQGLEVQTRREEEDLGDLDDLVLDFDQGLVAYGLITVARNEQAAVPWAAIEIRPQEQIAFVDATQQQLEQIAFHPDRIPNLADPQYAQRIHTAFDREPYWEVLGFVGRQDRQQRMRRPQQQQQWQDWDEQQQWGEQREQRMRQREHLSRHFDPDRITVISGTIQMVGTFQDAEVGVQAQRLRLRTRDRETVTVLTGPRRYLEQQDLTLERGERVQVRGSFAQIEGRRVFIASDIRTEDVTVQLRDRQGRPMYREMAQRMRQRDR